MYEYVYVYLRGYVVTTMTPCGGRDKAAQHWQGCITTELLSSMLRFVYANVDSIFRGILFQEPERILRGTWVHSLNTFSPFPLRIAFNITLHLTAIYRGPALSCNSFSKDLCGSQLDAGLHACAESCIFQIGNLPNNTSVTIELGQKMTRTDMGSRPGEHYAFYLTEIVALWAV